MSAHSPYQDLLPPLSTEEFQALAADIKANGVLHKIFVDEDGNILDGHHRLQIDPGAPRQIVHGLSPAEKEAFVFRANFVRRNLSPDQKREANRKMKATAARLREENAKKWTQAAVAKALGVARETARDWVTTNGASTNGSKASQPDARVKVSSTGKQTIARRVEAGESQTQIAADIGVSQQTVSKIVTTERKKSEDAQRRTEAAQRIIGAPVSQNIVHGDFREKSLDIPDASAALVFTDPPYDRESLPLYRELAKMAQRVLVDGGSLITYCGHYLLPDVIQSLSAHLRYFWICAVVHTGGVAQMREYGIKVKWKPLLWFVKGEFRRDRDRWIEDAFASSEEKTHHPWQQSVLDARHFIEALTDKDELVVDTFCGGGTTCLAAKELGRKWIAFDTDGAAVETARKRIE